MDFYQPESAHRSAWHASSAYGAPVAANDATHAQTCATLIVGITTTAVPELLRSECEILLDVKDTLRGTAPLNWGADVEFNQWEGITVLGGNPNPREYGIDSRVSVINLSGFDLNGEIPPELGGLTALTVLSLWNNDLTGTIPAELGNLTSVTTLSLSENQLTGSIPSALGGLSSVRYLYLRTNQLTGAIPSELGSLAGLVQLSLSQNRLSGTIPSQLGSLSRLTHLYLNENELAGTIPTQLGNLTAMVELNLSHNQLTGSIPTELGTLGRSGTTYSLTYLNLGHNKLSGNVPSGLGLHLNLTHLYLNNNQLEGDLEADVANGMDSLDALTHLYLNENQFEGYVPAALGDSNLYGLQELSLHGNEFDPYSGVDGLLSTSGASLGYLSMDADLISANGMQILLGPSVYRSLYLELPDEPTPSYADADRTYVSWRYYDPDSEYYASASAATLPAGATLDSQPDYVQLALHLLDEAGNPIVGGRLPEPAVVCMEPDLGRLFSLTEGSSMWKQLPTGNPTGLTYSYSCGQTRDLATFVTGDSTVQAPAEEAAVARPVKREVTSDGETFRAVVDGASIVLSVPPGAVEPGESLEFTFHKAEGPLPRGFTVSSSPKIIEINLPDDVEPGANITVCMEKDMGLPEEQQSLLHLGDGPASRWAPLPKRFEDPENYNLELGWVCGFTRDFSKFTIGLVDSTALGPIRYIKSIEPSIRGATVSQGDVIRLSFDIYGRQDILDNGLGEGHVFGWDDGGAGGSFRTTDRPNEVVYTAPSSPGTHAVTVTSPNGVCLRGEDADETVDRCTARFTITVRRPSAAPEERPVPENPIGEIPSVLVDAEGRQYEVFTPEEGGLFDSGDVTISAEPGVVPNLEIVGVRVDVAGAASNVGQSHHRYSLAGMWHEVRAVDADGAPLSSYLLQDPLEVCLPLPDVLRSNISDVALVSSNADGSLTILSSSVRIMASGTRVCGGLSELPASVAVGRLGSPADLPTPTPEAGETGLPDTGGYALEWFGLVLLMVLGGSLLLVFGTRLRRMG